MEKRVARTAILIGATGLVGEACLDYLLQSPAYEKLTVFTRRPLDYQNPKLTTHVIDFDKLDEFGHLIRADDIYCCLGTTIRKAKSKENFRKIDYEYCVEFARRALAQGAKQFLLVSSLGANSESPFFYLRTKGELEEALMELGFDSLSVLQPSLLLGDRNESRPGEKMMMHIHRYFDSFFIGPMKSYRGIEARNVALAMVSLGEEAKPGFRRVVSQELAKLAHSGH